jgi:hypothetical protein
VSKRAFPWAKAGYLEWHSEADRRNKRGEVQRYCLGCERWRWDDEPCWRQDGKPPVCPPATERISRAAWEVRHRERIIDEIERR